MFVGENEKMLAFRESDNTWYLGKARMMVDKDAPPTKIFEVVDSDTSMQSLRLRYPFRLNIPHIIIFREHDTADDLVGWADPYQR